jgi:hypothetical protein
LRAGGTALFARYKNIAHIIEKNLPEVGLRQTDSTLRSHKRERLMFKTLKEIFLTQDVMVNYIHPDLRYVATNRKRTLQLDVFFPNLMLAFEYQGEQHYGRSAFLWEETSTQMQRDQLKSEICRNVGITLVAVPYWWDGSRSQLEAAIYKVCYKEESRRSSLELPSISLLAQHCSNETPSTFLHIQ